MMSLRRRLPIFAMVLQALALASMAGLFFAKLTNDQRIAARIVGMSLEELPSNLRITSVTEGRPAAQAGLREGDLLLAVTPAGGSRQALGSEFDYDRVANGFDRQPVIFWVEREGQERGLQVVPGIAVDRGAQLTSLVLVLCFLTIAGLSLGQRYGDVRARLLATFCFLLALEFASPTPVGVSYLDALGAVLYYLVTGAQIAVELHLVMVIPDRQPWLTRRPWVVPLLYCFGLGFGLAGASAEMAARFDWPSLLPLPLSAYEEFLAGWLFPVWAFGLIGILALPTFRHPQPEARNQAGLIFLGVLPWCVYAVVTSVLPALGIPTPGFFEAYFPVFMLCFAAAVFVAIFRFHLFDLELVVKRSFLYTALTTTLVLAYCFAIGVGSLLFSSWMRESEYSVIFTSAVMFLVGLTFSSLRKALQGLIDRRLFPERQALRRRLIELAAELPARGTIAGMGSHLVERLGEILGAHQSTLLLADPKSGLLFTIAAAPRRTSDDSSISFLIPPTDPALERLRVEGRPLAAAEIFAASPQLARRFGALDPALVAPLLSQEKLVGLLVLGRPTAGGSFRAEEVELLSLLTHQIATAFENIRLFESATYESLTGLLRREAVLEVLDKEIDRAQRHDRPLVLGIADLDFFKSINDRYGHLAGDAVLKRVADELAGSLRSSDILGRYGGEEFLLVFPETDLEGGRGVAEKLRRRIGKMVLPMPDGSTVALSISIGLAGGRLRGQDALTRTELIENADRALYRAKALGRNRVELAQIEPSGPDSVANVG